MIKLRPGRFNSSIIWCLYNYYLKFVQFMIWKNLLINKIHTNIKSTFAWGRRLLCGCSICKTERERKRTKSQVSASLAFDFLRDFFIPFSTYNGAQAPINDLFQNSQWIGDYLRIGETNHASNSICVYLLDVTFKFLIIVAYTISINILSGLICWDRAREREREKPTLLWTNKIDRDYLACAPQREKSRFCWFWWQKGKRVQINAQKHTKISQRAKMECNSDNKRQSTVDNWPADLQIAIVLRNHVIRSIDWFHPVCAE